jgi:hypothetical protein
VVVVLITVIYHGVEETHTFLLTAYAFCIHVGGMAKKTNPKPQPETVRVPLSMPAELDVLITTTAAEVKLSKQDTMRLSLERGLPILKRLLTMSPEAVEVAA